MGDEELVEATPEEVPETAAAEPTDEAPEEIEAVDERGVSWKNVAKEHERKADEARREAELMKRLLAEGTTKPPPTPEPEPETPDLQELWKEGKVLDVVRHITREEQKNLEKTRARETATESAAKTQQKLLGDYPALADKTSDLYQATVDAGNELKREWKAMGLEVDVPSLERQGLIPLLERQAVERAVAKNPSLVSKEEVEIVTKRKTSSPSEASVVTQGTGKPPASKKPAGTSSKLDVTEEEIERRRRYGLPVDEASLKKYAQRKKEVGYFSDQHRREQE